MAPVPQRLAPPTRGPAAVLRALVGLAALTAASAAGPGAQLAVSQASPPRRIVSLVPAATEMLFAIGARDRIVGVSSYDRFPPPVASLPKVGGLLDPNVERLLSLRPDLVIAYGTQTDLRQQLASAGIPMFVYTHRDLADVTTTLRALGERVGSGPRAAAEAAGIERALAEIGRRVRGRSRPRTLLVIGHEPGTLRQIHASGGYGFLHDLLVLAGAEDVLGDLRRESVMMSTEMVLTRAPEIILDLHYGDALAGDRLDEERDVWRPLRAVPAVRNRRVHVLVGDEFVVPGPRIVAAAERFARTLHLEAGGR